MPYLSIIVWPAVSRTKPTRIVSVRSSICCGGDPQGHTSIATSTIAAVSIARRIGPPKTQFASRAVLRGDRQSPKLHRLSCAVGQNQKQTHYFVRQKVRRML